MIRFGWRAAAVVLFAPLGALVVAWMLGVIIAASAAWLVRGQRRDGQPRIDRWAFGAGGRAAMWPLDRLLRKADMLRDVWVQPR